MNPDSYVRIELKESDYHLLLDSGVFEGIEHELKEVKIKDDYFKDDPVHKAYRDKSNKAYKDLQQYEFKKRNNTDLSRLIESSVKSIF